MRWQVEKLASIANKPVRTIIGLMSGTSLDGLDIACVKIRGQGVQTTLELIAFESCPYDLNVRQQISAVFAKEQIEFRQLLHLNVSLARLHSQRIKAFMSRFALDNEQIDLIASHGQTVLHQPRRSHSGESEFHSSLQIVDGDHIAHACGIITLSDFRQKHIAAGKEGAPLASYGDFLLFQSSQENRVLLNLGGIANLTYLPKAGEFGEIVSSDVGPANTLIDAYVRQHYPDLLYDLDGKIASRGQVQPMLLDTMLEHPFFKQAFPKSTGPEEFSLPWLASVLRHFPGIKTDDVVRTLVDLSAHAVKHAVHTIAPKNCQLFISGGGVHNPVLMTRIKALVAPVTVKQSDALGINADAKEAILFALLANEAIAGEAQTFKGNVHYPNISMGKISFPY